MNERIDSNNTIFQYFNSGIEYKHKTQDTF